VLILRVSVSRPPLLAIATGASLVAARAWAGAQDTPAAPAPQADGDVTAALIGPPRPGGLTADEVGRRAASTSPEVRARAEESAAALESVAQTRAGYIPRLAGSSRYTRLSRYETESLGNLVTTPPNTAAGVIPPNTPLISAPFVFPQVVDQYANQVSLQVPVSDYFLRLPALTAAARGNARAAALMEEASRLRVATNARIAFYDWARARMQTDVAERAVEQARLHLKDVVAVHETGAASKADVLLVEAQMASAELALTRASSGEAFLARRLRILMHDREARAYEVGEDLRDAPEAAAITSARATPPEALLQTALARRLEPRALDENAEATRAQARAALSLGLPRLDAVANGAYSRPNLRLSPLVEEFRATWDVGVQLSWTPTDIFSTQASRRGTLARARAIEAERADLVDGIETEIAQALQALAQAEVAMRTSARGLAAAEESYRVRRLLFQNGRATSVELTDAETELSRARLEVIAARIDRRVGEARLVHALGLDVGGGMSP
jgi:outer membrane protein TolC